MPGKIKPVVFTADQHSSARLRWFSFYQRIALIKQQGKDFLVSHLYSRHTNENVGTRWIPVNNAQWGLSGCGLFHRLKPISHDSGMVVFFRQWGAIMKNEAKMYTCTNKKKKKSKYEWVIFWGNRQLSTIWSPVYFQPSEMTVGRFSPPPSPLELENMQGWYRLYFVCAWKEGV